MATARGAITLTDVTDGLETINIFQTNENHTFSAPASGVVTDFTGYTNDIIVTIGDVQASYVTVSPTVDNTYTVGTPTVAPLGDIDTSVATNNQARFIGTGNVDVARVSVDAYTQAARDVTVTYPVTIRRQGANNTYNILITFSKAIGGNAVSLNMSASRSYFQYPSPTSTALPTDATITITADYDGPSGGSFQWFRMGATTTGTTIARAGVSGTTNTQTLTAADFNTFGPGTGDVAYITYEVTRSGVTDRLTIFRLNTGAASFIVVPSVSSGSPVFKNNAGSVTLQCKVFDGATELSDLTGWSFVWTGPPANDEDGTPITLSSTTPGIALSNFNNGTNAQLVADATYVEDGKTAAISVVGTNS